MAMFQQVALDGGAVVGRKLAALIGRDDGCFHVYQAVEQTVVAQIGRLERELLRLGAPAEQVAIDQLVVVVLPPRPHQNSAEPGVRGAGITSRIFFMPVTYMSMRSRPRPKPECGAVPYFRRSRYHQYAASFSPWLRILSRRTSYRSSLWLPPMISPMRGASTSMARTVFPSSFRRM